MQIHKLRNWLMFCVRGFSIMSKTNKKSQKTHVSHNNREIQIFENAVPLSKAPSPHTDVLFLLLLLGDIVRMWDVITLMQGVFLFTLINVILTEVII